MRHSDGGRDKGNRHNDEENGQNVHSSILRFFEILFELASSWPESSLVDGLTADDKYEADEKK